MFGGGLWGATHQPRDGSIVALEKRRDEGPQREIGEGGGVDDEPLANRQIAAPRQAAGRRLGACEGTRTSGSSGGGSRPSAVIFAMPRTSRSR